jgi:hypothetical protein
MEDHLLTETTRFRQLGAHATVGSYARPPITSEWLTFTEFYSYTQVSGTK